MASFGAKGDVCVEKVQRSPSRFCVDGVKSELVWLRLGCVNSGHKPHSSAVCEMRLRVQSGVVLCLCRSCRRAHVWMSCLKRLAKWDGKRGTHFLQGAFEQWVLLR